MTKPDTKGARGQHLNLPLAGSSARREAQDKNGNKSWVYDVTMHPEAFQMLHKHSNMLQAMVESAIEHIEKANSVKLGRQFSRPKLKFKGTPGHEQKPAVTVRLRRPHRTLCNTSHCDQVLECGCNAAATFSKLSATNHGPIHSCRAGGNCDMIGSSVLLLKAVSPP